jgi:hypothetical protein
LRYFTNRWQFLFDFDGCKVWKEHLRQCEEIPIILVNSECGCSIHCFCRKSHLCGPPTYFCLNALGQFDYGYVCSTCSSDRTSKWFVTQSATSF